MTDYRSETRKRVGLVLALAVAGFLAWLMGGYGK